MRRLGRTSRPGRLGTRHAKPHRRYTEAARYIAAGMELKPTGTALARLASGQAQCAAHVGDIAGTRAALAAAEEAIETVHGPEEFSIGLFGFPRSKVHYYAASSLIWLPEAAGARTADAEATTAIGLFQAGPADERFVTDEILAHIYQATARVMLGDIDAAADSLRPVLTIPAESRVSWHRRRLDRIAGMLTARPFRRSATATELRNQIAAF